MLWIPLRQRRRAVGGQGIHAGAMVDPISGHIGVVPGALAHRRDPRHDAWRHFRRKTDFAALIKNDDWYAQRERGTAVGIFNSSTVLGQAIAPPALVIMQLAWGWRTMFVVIGLAGIVVGLCW